MKTIIEWLEELPEPYRTEAIENCRNDQDYTGNVCRTSLNKALSGAFIWVHTPQGYEYWSNLHDTL